MQRRRKPERKASSGPGRGCGAVEGVVVVAGGEEDVKGVVVAGGRR